MKTRLFFVVDEEESEYEIFETLEEAQEYIDRDEIMAKIWIAMVKNAYKDKNGWNYDDYSETFNLIKRLQ